MTGSTPIPGTTVFDGEQARKGYALNRMCYSFNTADNRASFQRDPDGYMRGYGLDVQDLGAAQTVWLAARTAVPGPVRKAHANYQIPISNTAAGMMALESVQEQQ